MSDGKYYCGLSESSHTLVYEYALVKFVTREMWINVAVSSTSDEVWISNVWLFIQSSTYPNQNHHHIKDGYSAVTKKDVLVVSRDLLTGVKKLHISVFRLLIHFHFWHYYRYILEVIFFFFPLAQILIFFVHYLLLYML